MAMYSAYRFKELAATQTPCGMNDLLARGIYASVHNFMRFTKVDHQFRALAIRGFREVVIFAEGKGEDMVVARVNLANHIDWQTDIVGRREAGTDYQYTVESQAPAGNWVRVGNMHHLDEALSMRKHQYSIGNIARIVDEHK